MKFALYDSFGLRPLITFLLLFSLFIQARAEDVPLDLINALDTVVSARYPPDGPRGAMNYSLLQRNGVWFACTDQGHRQSDDYMFALWRHDESGWHWVKQLHTGSVDEHLDTSPSSRFSVAFRSMGLNADDQKRLLRNFREFPRAQIARGKWSKWKTEFLRSLRQAVILRNPQRADDYIQVLLVDNPWTASVGGLGFKTYEIWQWEKGAWRFRFQAERTYNPYSDTKEIAPEEAKIWEQAGLPDSLRRRLDETQDTPSLPDW